MADGITKEEFVEKKAKLVTEITNLEVQEKANSAALHTAKAEKERLKLLIISAKNKMTLYDKFIEESHPIKTVASIPR